MFLKQLDYDLHQIILVAEVLVDLILLVLDGALFPWGEDLGNLELGSIPPERIHTYSLVLDTRGSCHVRELHIFRFKVVFEHSGVVNLGCKCNQGSALWLQLVRDHTPPLHTRAHTHSHSRTHVH